MEQPIFFMTTVEHRTNTRLHFYGLLGIPLAVSPARLYPCYSVQAQIHTAISQKSTQNIECLDKALHQTLNHINFVYSHIKIAIAHLYTAVHW